MLGTIADAQISGHLPRPSYGNQGEQERPEP